MKLIDKIHSLLQSKNLNDIFIAIQLSYSLPFEEFNNIFNDRVKTGVLPQNECYYFLRNKRIYYMGCAYLGRHTTDVESYEDFLKSGINLNNKYIDLTPEEFK